VEVFLVERLLFQFANARNKVLMEGAGAVLDGVLGWIEDRGFVLDGSGWLGGLLRRYQGFGDHLAGGMDVSDLVSFWSDDFRLPVELLIERRRWLLGMRVKLGYWLIRGRRDGVDRAAGNVLVSFDSGLFFYWSFDHRRALAELAGSDGVDPVRSRSFGGLVLDGSYWLLVDRLRGSGDLGKQGLGYFLRHRNDAGTINLVDYFSARLLRLGGVAELLPWFGAAMAREGLAGKGCSAVPAFRDSVAGYLGEDDGCVNWLCGSRYRRLFTALAIFRERLAGEHDRLERRAVGGRGVVDAIKRSLGSEATRNPGRALVAVAVASTAAAVFAVATATVVASATITAVAGSVVLLRAGCGVSVGNGSGRIRNRLFGCSVDIVGVVLNVGRSVVRSGLRL
jgi:hypothetical protein